MRIRLVTCEYPPVIGGIASHVAELAKALTSEVRRVTVVHPVALGSRYPDFDVRGVTTYRPSLVKAQPFYTIALKHWLSAAFKRDPYDIVHIHGVRPLAAASSLSCPVVFTNHSSGFLSRMNATAARKRKTTRLLKHVSHLVAPSDELLEAARTLGYDGPGETIPNGVDVNRFRRLPSGLRAEWGISDDEVVVLLARRLVEKNGVIWFARAVTALRHINFRVVVAGDGEERKKMHAIFSEAGMTERVLFLGAVANSQMPNVYSAADISVLPSLAEATSISGLEAMACGLPLIGTNIGGIPTIIDNGVTGTLVPARDPAALARELERLILSADLRARLGAAGRAAAQNKFSWHIAARRTREIYRHCLDSRRLEEEANKHSANAGASQQHLSGRSRKQEITPA